MKQLEEEAAQPPSNIVESQQGYQKVRLESSEKNLVLVELTNFLIKEGLAQFAHNCLCQIEDKESFEVKSCQARVFLIQKEFTKASALLEEMVAENNVWIQGYNDLGHAYYQLKDFDNAKRIYFKSIRISNLTQQPIEDRLVFQRAGSISAAREEWEDARVMFLMCAEDFKTAYSFFNLGLANYHLKNYEQSETELAHVNYLDPTHAETWAYLCLVQLKKEDKQIFAAYQSMNEAIKLNLKNTHILKQIFINWVETGSFKAAKEAIEYARIIEAGKHHKFVYEYLK